MLVKCHLKLSWNKCQVDAILQLLIHNKTQIQLPTILKKLYFENFFKRWNQNEKDKSLASIHIKIARKTPPMLDAYICIY